ncbi:polyketide synthase subunit [Lentzea aerocolonigenes]|uniref:Polyketide synthase subunit n=1 Tax=Lentzea aerocolonigenes TaxID=68170 RepID=A0A0F0GNZ2_LENAE|nr:type I polyketide synthase [Lentzea aerocolonigenes]KJK43667.1 polyketide synthase subunit [Lentzea aerocolonigenes]
MTRDRAFDIAVTGMSGRFPGAATVAELWSAVTAGQVLTTRLGREDLAGVPADLLDDPDYVPARGWLADADRFDHELFRFSGRDAELMDPQHRLMLEVAWTALEDAGQGPLRDGPVTGVYASDSGSGYLRAMLASGPLDPQTLDHAIHGTEPDFIASLISYKLDLTGPAIGVRTACSSSLVGLHLAVQALLNGDCDQALVVAAGIDFPQAGHLHIPGGIQSASGACRPFDAGADGVLAGSGVACVVLRRLADALAGGVEPHGVVLATAINNDGAAKAGYYAPSISGQEAVIRAAVAAADVDASSIGYLETHGTGTKVGDPIEWSAASDAYRALGAAPGQIAIGALKANTGHLDAAAGLGALIKALLVVREGVVPPVAGFTSLNPLLETDGSPLFVPAGEEPWTGPEPRRAAISSFGIGGTNAHVLVEQPPRPHVLRSVPRAHGSVLLLSAGDAAALDRASARLGDHVVAEAPDLADVAFTLAEGRAVLPHRLAVHARTPTELATRLASGDVARGHAAGPASAVFLFPGQGSQHPGMALPFAAALPGFTDALEDTLAAFAPPIAARIARALTEETFPAATLASTELAQPALFALEFAVTTALAELGVTPVALAGHSLGEITAATVSGVLDLPAAARLVTARGRAMQACPPGAMVALDCAEATALELIASWGHRLEVAAVNAPHACVLAGSLAEVDAFTTWLDGRVRAKVLRTSHAFHSELIAPALPALEAELAAAVLRPPALPFALGTTGALAEPGAAVDPGEFVRQARQPVRFGAALAAVTARFPSATLVEVGPGSTLTAAAAAADLTAVPLSPGRAAPADAVLAALGELWTCGLPVDTSALCVPGRLIHLPGYQFHGRRWLAPEAAAAQPAVEAVRQAEAEPATTDPSGLLSSLWAELLGHHAPGADDDFFELGGDSMLITQLARRVHQELGVRVSLRGMLAARTLGGQITHVRDLLTTAA